MVFKGWGKSWAPTWGKSWGKGKGKSSGQSDSATLAKIDPSLKVWVGGVSADSTWKELQELFSGVGKVKYAAVFAKSGTGCVAFTSPGDVETAIATLNGSILGSSSIQVDYFEKPAGREAPKKGKGKGKTATKTSWKKPSWTMTFAKRAWTPTWQKGKGKGKVSEVKKLAKVDASLKVWVGGVAADTTWKALQEHFESAGKVTWAKVFPKGGTACVAFKTAEEAESAISSLDGSTLGSSVIQCDTFVKQEKP